MNDEDLLACARCRARVDARVADVMVCEGCLGRYHAACWSDPCACGAGSAIAVARLVVPALRVPVAPPRERRLSRIVVGAGLGAIALGLASFGRVATTPEIEPAKPPVVLRAPHDEAPVAAAVPARVDEPLDAAALFHRAYVHGEAREYDAAIADYTRYLELDPASYWAWNNRGFCRGRRGDFEGALDDGNKALSLSADHAYLWNNRGYALMHLGDLEHAAADIARSLALDPGNPYAWENRGHLRLLRGDLAGARADFEKSLEVDTANVRRADVEWALRDLREKALLFTAPR